MNKHLWILILTLAVALAVTGCSAAASGGGNHNQEEQLEPLDAAAWPTAVPATVRPSPTPFPKVTLAPTPTRRANPAAELSPTPVLTEGVSYDGDMEQLVEQVTTLSGGLEPVAAFMVTDDGASILQGPGGSYGTVASVEQAELGAVLGTDSSGAWLYVLTITGVQGWIPADAMRIMGSVAAAPVLPADPLAASAGAAASNSGSGAASQAVSAVDLVPVTTAVVNSELLNMRQGPGAAYDLLGTLSKDDELSVLALNKDRDWVMVETADGQRAWVTGEYLEFEGTLEDVPSVLTARPDSISAGSGAAAPAPSTEESAEPAVSLPQLGELTTARTNQGLIDLYRQPTTDSEPIATLGSDVGVAVLALNQQGDWALVEPDDIFTGPGWMPLSQLNVEGSLDSVPSVSTGWVESHGVKVRLGPALYHQEIGALGLDDMVALLGQSDDGSWLLVRPVTGGGAGWVPSHFILFDGNLQDVPVMPPTVLTEGGGSQAEPAPAAEPRSEPLGKLALQLSSGGDIVLLDSDGSNLRTLAQGIDPVLSPDGQQVAFTRWLGDGDVNNSSLWVANTDGSGEREILGEMRKAKGPDWSPDGSRIVLNYQDGGRLEFKRNCVNLVDVQMGEDPMPNIPWNAYGIGAKTGEDGMPYLCWNLPPDAYWSLRLVDVADGSHQDFYGGTYGFRPAWDPIQDWRVVADSGYGLIEADVNSERSQGITDGLGDGSPVISPDGRYIAVVSNENDGYDIHRLNADGSGRVRLTQTPLWVTAQPGDNQDWQNVAPEWSPDGSQIAFLTDRTGRWEIWVMNVDGSDPHPMFSDEINDQLPVQYDLNDERVISWR